MEKSSKNVAFKKGRVLQLFSFTGGGKKGRICLYGQLAIPTVLKEVEKIETKQTNKLELQKIIPNIPELPFK